MAETTTAIVFAELAAKRAALLARSVLDLFAADPGRFDRFHAELDDLLYDFSKQRLDGEAFALLLRLAEVANVAAKRDAMFRGDLVNTTERRAALHSALRNFSGEPVLVEGADVMPEVEAVRAKMLEFAADVREGRVRGALGQPMTDVVNIGIGGSDLGPAMAARALAPFGQPNLTAHFVSNVDGADIADTLHGLDPARTLFIVSSKTFTTQETMTNAHSARAWIVAALGEAAVPDHFAAVSTQLDKVAEFGVQPDRVFGFWDWVGGRYSIWSSIGLPLAIVVGPEAFIAFLHGGYEVDRHFREAPPERNIPLLMGLVSVWNRNLLGYASQAVIPYDQRLGRFPAYLQQLNMESNGKSVRRDGASVERATGPIVWGEPGTNGQHAFFQLLHQGTEIAPIDFLDRRQANRRRRASSRTAGRQLLRPGRSADARTNAAPRPRRSHSSRARAPRRPRGWRRTRRSPAAGRPRRSSIASSTPRTLGRLIALYEHKVFVEAAIWDINPFDQWGVELGKELASRLAPIVADPTADLSALDRSTAGLIGHVRALRG